MRLSHTTVVLLCEKHDSTSFFLFDVNVDLGHGIDELDRNQLIYAIDRLSLKR